MILDAEDEKAKLHNDKVANHNDEVWCFCDMPEKDYNEDQPMVFCQGTTCKRKWFHFTCIGKATTWSADGDYYCPSCQRDRH